METIPDGLLSAVRGRYGIDGRSEPMAPGVSGSLLWRLDSTPPVLVRVARHYELEDLRRSCRVARAFSRVVPEAVPPLIALDGEVAFFWNGQPVTVWPFLDGRELDRHEPAQLRQAARLLARLHQSAAVYPRVGDGQIPGSDNAEAAATLLPDRELDEWLRSWRVIPADAEATGWMHGDFFWRNILWRQGKIVGLIDWDDAWWGQLIIDLAWSVWEFGKSAAGDALLLDRATEFLTVYRQAGGPVQASKGLIPIIRERLRRDITFFRKIGAKGYQIDPVDEQAKYAAFESLGYLNLPVIGISGD